jgi:hypothetical protein
MEVRMPPEFWDDREVLFYCPVCDRTLVHRSMYLNLDSLIEMGMTQAEFALALHGERHLLYGIGQCPACDGCGWLWTEPNDETAPKLMGRCPNGCPDGETIDWYLAMLSG